jgi:amidase
MQIEEYSSRDAVGLADLVRRREVTPLEVVEAAIGAVEAIDPQLHALVLKDYERARGHARAVQSDLPLSGVPFLIKDMVIYADGWPTTHCSRFFANATPRPDSEIVRRWRAAGAVFLGKTNSPEFAEDFATEPAFRGPTFNPWNSCFTVGGSSGGAAAAVASGMVPVAHGSDLGGSIRVPAACCGVFGLKPSRGLNPAGPYATEASGGLNCEHVISRSVRDSAAFLDATAGPEPGAPYSVQRAVPSYLKALDQPLPPLRIASLDRRMDGTRIDPEIAARVADAAAMLEALGHTVVAGSFPEALAPALAGDSWSALWLLDIAQMIEEHAAELARRPAPGEIEQFSSYILARVKRMSALEYMTARKAAHTAALAMAREFAPFDFMLLPTTSTLPIPLGSTATNGPGFDYGRWVEIAYGFAPFTEIFNVTGQPAASLPLFQAANGMPIGMQLVGRQNEDHRLLRLAADLELMSGWRSRHPPLWAGGTA